MFWGSAPEFPVSSVSGSTHCCRVSFEGDDLTMATGRAVSHIHQRVLVSFGAQRRSGGSPDEGARKGRGMDRTGRGPHPDRGPDEVQEWRLLQLRFPNRIFGVDL